MEMNTSKAERRRQVSTKRLAKGRGMRSSSCKQWAIGPRINRSACLTPY